MDLILRNSILADDGEAPPRDIGIDDGRIVAIQPDLAAEGPELDLEGRLVVPGFVETHIHLDKSCILDRCQSERGDLGEAVESAQPDPGIYLKVGAQVRGALQDAFFQRAPRARLHVFGREGLLGSGNGLDGLA